MTRAEENENITQTKHHNTVVGFCQVSDLNGSTLSRNAPYSNSLEMSSGDFTPVMPGQCVGIGDCIFSRDGPEEGHISCLIESFVAFDE